MHVYKTHILKLGMDQKREKEGMVIRVIYKFDIHIYTTHDLKLGMDQRREKKSEWLFIDIYTFDMHIIYTTHRLKMGIDQRREKEGVVIHRYLYI